ncbi:hypothetical protein [Chelativorans sp. M5D2P16]|uniref:hypothetical protein n=1 Tax=Chelativorans sp. M5D2P16 TaxID=3095678 RepID=UPI002ACAD50D|nr:hypothetical protein [Chelativorans sp. M5D2P16]MDZ5698227.1 hypothetical protein [Chelativorans sp. M5D2P16]
MLKRLFKPAMIAAAALAVQPALAQETEAPAAKLGLELNSLAPTENGCRVTFVISNAMGAEIENAAFEIALFDQDRMVDRLTVIEFGELPAEKTKVSQFDFAGADCANIGRILINGVTECNGAILDTQACGDALETTTRTNIEFGS